MAAAALALRRGVALGVVAAATWLSVTPAPPSPQTLPPHADLVVHFVMHTGVAGALSMAWPTAVAGPAAATLAVVLELAQLQTPGREFSLLDMAANGCGAATGLSLWAWLSRRFFRARRSP